jgi:hypothetical protein
MTAQIKQLSARSANASRLRQRKYALVRQYGIPENLIGGSLAPTRRRCGKPNCHCSQGEGHLQWSVTFCQGGTKRVERVPLEWVAELEQAVLETQRYLDAMRQVMAINIELLAQTRAQEQQKKVRRREENAPVSPKNDQQSPDAIDHLTM